MMKDANNSIADRVVLRVPREMTLDELARLCRVSEGSSAFEALEDALPLINRHSTPKAVIRRVGVDSIDGDKTSVGGTVFVSRIMADKLSGLSSVFISVVTAGDGMDDCEDLADDPFLDVFKGAVLSHAVAYVERYLLENHGFDGSSTLNPGSLPDWPISNNFALFDLLGGADDIGVSLNAAGYIRPWNSVSRIHFPGNGYENCSLCKKPDCPRRRAVFDVREYRRIFGSGSPTNER